MTKDTAIPVYRTSNGTQIIVLPGTKSPKDFIVKYQEPSKRIRTPKHIHLVVDLFAKRTGNLALANNLLDHIIETIILRVAPATSFPPSITLYTLENEKQFRELDKYGEYSVEFLLVVIELIMVQEKTNYPTGTLNLSLFRKFRNGADIFSVVSAATFR